MHGWCLDCEYGLEGLPAGKCPECGRPFDHARPETFGIGLPLQGRHRLALVGLGLLVVFGFVLLTCVRAYAAGELFVAVIVGLPGFMGFFVGAYLRRVWPSVVGTVLAILPSMFFLTTFYSLAVHMRLSLGDWPDRIGTEGFPLELVQHVEITAFVFGWTLLGFVFALPVVMLACVGIARGRRFVFYLGTSGIAFALVQGLIAIAPAPFLNWWWD